MSLRVLSNILLLAIAISSSETSSFTDDELVSVRVCGDALHGENPCDWVKHVDVAVSYIGKSDALKNSLVTSAKAWFKGRVWSLLRHADINVVDKHGWFYFAQPKNETININLLVYDLEKDSESLTLSVVTSTSERYQVFSYSCPRSKQMEIEQCLSSKVEEGLALLLSGSFENSIDRQSI